MSSGEIVEVLGPEGQVVGTVSREEADRDSLMIKNVLVFVFDSLGKLWIHRRPDDKQYFAGLWDISACGAVQSGESHEAAAYRETAEETQLTDILLHYGGSFINEFEDESGRTRRFLSHTYVGQTAEAPQTNPDAAEFALWNPDELKHHAQTNPSLYIRSFLTELDHGIEAYQAFLGSKQTKRS